MKLINNILYIEFRELAELGTPTKTIKSGISRRFKSWQSIKDPTDRRKRLIRYDTLRSKYKKLIRSEYGDPYEHLKRQRQQQQIKEKKQAQANLPNNINVRTADISYYQAQPNIDEDTAYQLARSAAWLRFLEPIKKKKQCKRYGCSTKKELYRVALDHINQEDLKGLNVSSIRVLQRKINKLKKEGRPSLISRKYGNKNSVKLNRPAKVYLRQIYADPHKLPFSQIWLHYIQKANEKGWPKVHEETIRQYLCDPSVQSKALKERRQKTEWRDDYDTTIRRKRPTYPDDLWVMDGTPIELYFREGNKLHNRMYGFFVVDARSLKILGYDLKTGSETIENVYRATKRACTIHGCVPHQLQFDNSSALKSPTTMDWFEKMSRFVTPTGVGNARAKIIEALNGHFNNQVLRYFDNYSGANITAKKTDSHPNQDYLKKHAKNFPTKQKVIEQIHTAIAIWNEMVAGNEEKTRNELYAQGSPRKRPLSYLTTVSLFWLERKGTQGKGILYTKEGITIQVKGEKFTYWVPDPEFMSKHLRDRFTVRYDPDDMSEVCLYKDGKFVATAEPKKEVPMAIVDFTPEDWQEYHRQKQLKKDFEELIDEKNRKDKELLEAEGIAKLPLVSFDNRFKEELNRSKAALKQMDIVNDETQHKEKKTLYDADEEGGIVE